MAQTPEQRDDRIESVMAALFAECCPGIRFADDDAPLYRAAALAALAVLEGDVQIEASR